MRKIECACGISLDIYSWPPSEVEQNGKKMMERHISCDCRREIVVRTAPKYEPGADEPGEGEKVATVVSFAELSRQFGVLKDTEPYNKPPAAPVGEVAPTPKSSITLTEEQCALFYSLVMNYAKWFKQGKASAKAQKEFFDFADRLAPDEAIEISEEESRMCKMALSERNLSHVYGDEMSEKQKREVKAVSDALKSVIS